MPRNWSEDVNLVAKAMSGDPEAFRPIVERYQDAVFGVALARLRNFDDAEDVAQEVFVEAFQRLGNLNDPSRLAAWLRSIAVHKSVDLLRKRREHSELREVAEGMPDASTPHEETEAQELRDQVLAAIGRLSKVQRETVTLFYIDGYSQGEVAAMQEVPLGTVKRRLHDARDRLKEEMMTMVESVLKPEAPREEFSERVFRILNQHPARLNWKQIRDRVEERRAELEELLAQGMAGIAKAFESRHAYTRRAAIRMLDVCSNVESKEVAVQLLSRALNDTNKCVRQSAVRALLGDWGGTGFDVDEEQKRREIVPLIVPLLTDRSRRVRRQATRSLMQWAADVPLEAAVRAAIDERDSTTRAGMDALLCAILDARQQGGS